MHSVNYESLWAKMNPMYFQFIISQGWLFLQGSHRNHYMYFSGTSEQSPLYSLPVNESLSHQGTSRLQRKRKRATALHLPGFELLIQLRQLIQHERRTPVYASNPAFTKSKGSRRECVLPLTSCSVDSTKSQVKLLRFQLCN